MIARAISLVSVLCISALLFAGANAKDRPQKPDNPGKTEVEWIAFTGDLSGIQSVEGCCPNAGPFPEYTMTLSGVFGTAVGIHAGHLFINNWGAGKDHGYIVQFWDDSGLEIEITGGAVDYDRKTKILTVTFEDADCCLLGTDQVIAVVNFALVRSPYPLELE